MISKKLFGNKKFILAIILLGIVIFDSPTVLADDSVGQEAGGSAAHRQVSLDCASQLAPIGNQTVPLGSSLKFTVSLSECETIFLPLIFKGIAQQGNAQQQLSTEQKFTASNLVFNIEPKILPDNASFDTLTGEFYFRPTLSQVGQSYELTFTVQNGADTLSETITIDVIKETTTTALAGRLLDANEIEKGRVVPLAGATIRSLDTGQSVLSDEQGYFHLPDLPSGNNYIEYDGSTVTSAHRYASYRAQVDLIEDVNNVVDRPIYLMKIDIQGEVEVDPNATTVLVNEALGITMTVPPQTIKEEDGSNFDGMLSVSEVPARFTPGSLPDDLEPSLVVTIQPMGLTFDQPAPITFPNRDGLPAGTEVDLWSMSHAEALFFKAGRGRVSDDGLHIETISGGVQESSWHFPLPSSADVDEAEDATGENEDVGNDCSKPMGSTLSMGNGCLTTNITPPPYVSQGQARGVNLVYRSNRANPQALIPFQATFGPTDPIPETLSYRVAFAGVALAETVYLDTTTLTSGQENFIRGSIRLEVADLPTGAYPYTVRVTSDFGAAQVSGGYSGQLMIVNEQNSDFGAGWGLATLQKVYPQENDSLLVTEGNGSTQLFKKEILPLTPDVFSAPENYNTVNSPAALESADLNNDGHQDLLSAGWSNDVAIFMGDGTGTFAQTGVYAVNDIGSEGLAVADLNNDGHLDVVAANESASRISVLPGDGQGNLGSPIQTALPDEPRSIAVDDLNSDGNLDLAIAISAFIDNVIVLLGKGDGTFEAPRQFATEDIGQTITIGDFNRDGDLDLAVGEDYSFGSGPDIAVLVGDGAGNFNNVLSMGADFFPGDITAVDLDQDGILDLVTIHSDVDRLNIRYGTETGFEALVQVPLGGSPRALEVSDINQDGQPDLLVTVRSPSRVVALLDAGNRNFDERVELTVGDGIYGLAAADFDNDNDIDVAVNNFNADNFSVLLNLAGGSDVWSGPNGDFSTISQETDGTYVRTYKTGEIIRFDSAGRQTAAVDRNGNTTTYSYNGQGHLTGITDPVGQVTNLAYQNSRLSSITDPANRVTNFQHDADNNLVAVTFPDGTGKRFEYDARHLMTRETDARNFDTVRNYDGAGRVTNATLPGGVVRQATDIQQVGLIDPGAGAGTVNNPAPVTPVSAGVSTYTDGENRQTSYQIGALGRATGITDPAGFFTRIERNEDGLPTHIELPNGAVFDNVYDRHGNLLETTDQTLNGTFSFTYEPTFNLVTTITDPDGNTSQIDYDTNGNPIRFSSPLNREATVAYNGQGLPTLIVDTLGTETNVTYNAQGNVSTLQIGAGPEQRTSTLDYTAAGYLNQMTNALNQNYTFAYDDLGRLTTETLADGRTVNYAYDANSNLTAITPPGRPAHQFEYNELDLPAAYIPPEVGAGANRTEYSYNQAQQLTQINRPDGLATNFAYDAAGRLETVAIPDGNYAYTYDSNTGQLSALTAPSGPTLSFAYNAYLPSRITWSGIVAGSVGQSYDSQGRLQQLDVNNSNSINYTYNADSQPVTVGDLTLAYDNQTGYPTGSQLGQVQDSWTFNPFGEPTTYLADYSGTSVLYTHIWTLT